MSELASADGKSDSEAEEPAPIPGITQAVGGSAMFHDPERGITAGSPFMPPELEDGIADPEDETVNTIEVGFGSPIILLPKLRREDSSIKPR